MQRQIFLSYVKADQPWAERLSTMLATVPVDTSPVPSANLPGESFEASLRQAILGASHTLVLVGPGTRRSRRVDHEIELSTERRAGGPAARVIGVILPNHPDFRQPYYEPDHVPVRLHDLVQSEHALIRKWSEQSGDVVRWLEDATRRRTARPMEPSLAAVAELYHFPWDETVDEPRPAPAVA